MCVNWIVSHLLQSLMKNIVILPQVSRRLSFILASISMGALFSQWFYWIYGLATVGQFDSWEKSWEKNWEEKPVREQCCLSIWNNCALPRFSHNRVVQKGTPFVPCGIRPTIHIPHNSKNETHKVSQYRRAITPGGSYFFSVVNYRRQPILCDEPIRTALREAINSTQVSRPYWAQMIFLGYHFPSPHVLR